ncbi:MAG: multicopper oxidase domain-containing protein, partial [Betaproteobacteria bacterium]|nr:multicopper oxidase domain-containing protein [Betaproteobacteria bacterium]
MAARNSSRLAPGTQRTCWTRRDALSALLALPALGLAGCGRGSDGMGAMMRSSASTPPLASPPPPVAAPTLPVLPLDDGLLDTNGVRNFQLAVRSGTTGWFSGVATPTLGYNGALLGPALRLRKGEPTQITVNNTLAEPTTVHWHGLRVPADMDGGPHQLIAPGASWLAAFTVANDASTCWLHPHPHGNTGRQVALGLAGLLPVEDPARPATGVPANWGVDDMALVLQDKRFTAAGQIDYALTDTDRQLGYLGDRLLVNGVFGPQWTAPRQWVRLRLLNGCNARALTLRLGNGVPFAQIANEGGWLAQPVAMSTITLHPAQRAEVMIDLAAAAFDSEVALLASSPAGGVMGASATPEVTALRLRAALPATTTAVRALPAALPAPTPVVAPAGARTRGISLDGGMMRAPFTLNGQLFDMARIDFTAPAGAVEVWRFTNHTMMTHPMHVHGVRMSLLAT